MHNILLQVLDEGHLTDSHGRKVDFKSTIIIMTSNIGSQLQLSAATDGEAQSLVMEKVRETFAPEFLNRIDDMVGREFKDLNFLQIVFNRLSMQVIRSLVDLRLKDVERLLEEKSIKLRVDGAAREWLAENGFEPEYGARPLNRLIQHRLVNKLARLLLERSIRSNDVVEVSVSEDELSVKKAD